MLERCRAGGLQRKRKNLLQVKALEVLGIILEMVPKDLALCWLQGALRNAEQEKSCGQGRKHVQTSFVSCLRLGGKAQRSFLEVILGGEHPDPAVAPLPLCVRS